MIGRITHELAPGNQNPRNSEGAFIELKDGRILFVYSRYFGQSFDDGASADLYGIISGDGGETFGEPFPVMPCHRLSAVNVMSVSLLRMKNNDIGLFFLVKTSGWQCRMYLSRSSDEGESWSDPIPCIRNYGYYVVNNDRVVRLPGGRLLIPAAYTPVLYDQFTEKDGKKTPVHFLAASMFTYYSDDDGESWDFLGMCSPVFTGHNRLAGLQEPALVPLENGVIWGLARTDLGHIYETFSFDEGKNWTPPAPSAFTSAISPITVKRLADRRLLAVWNPVPVYNGRSQNVGGNFWTGARNPLAVATSADDGKNFRKPTPIETDETRGFAYTACCQLGDGSVLLGYSAGGSGDGCMLNRIRIRKISLKELENI